MSETAKARRPLKFNSVEELNVEIDRLSNGKYQKAGNWSLPQACKHLAMIIEGNLTPPTSDEPTADELAMKQKFFGMVMGPTGMPENMPIGNPELVPSADCTDAEILHLKTALKTLADYPHKAIKIGRCGPVPLEEVISLHLAHAAHHLSFLVPTDVRRQLCYADFDDAIADVQLLRSGYIRSAEWTLPQACWHMTKAINFTARAATAPATPEQLQNRSRLDSLIVSGKFPAKLEAPEQLLPPADSTDAEIDAYIAALNRVRSYAEPTAAHPRFGPINPVEYKKLILVHAAHHFSFLIPTPGH